MGDLRRCYYGVVDGIYKMRHILEMETGIREERMIIEYKVNQTYVPYITSSGCVSSCPIEDNRDLALALKALAEEGDNITLEELRKELEEDV